MQTVFSTISTATSTGTSTMLSSGLRPSPAIPFCLVRGAHPVHHDCVRGLLDVVQGDWYRTKDLVLKGPDWIVDQVKASGELVALPG